MFKQNITVIFGSIDQPTLCRLTLQIHKFIYICRHKIVKKIMLTTEGKVPKIWNGIFKNDQLHVNHKCYVITDMYPFRNKNLRY